MKLLIAAIAIAAVCATETSSSKKFHRHLTKSIEAVKTKATKAAGKAAKGNHNFYGYGSMSMSMSMSMSYPTPAPAPTIVPKPTTAPMIG
ncbi:hypothetical protein ACHAXM_001929, partial [Skeletonema potamos]